MADEDGEDGKNIREFLGPFVGCTLVEVTQQDEEEFHENRETRVYLHFSNGETISFPISDAGFDIS